MKSFNIALITFLILFSISNSLFAQSDYLITEKNDTIRCQLKRDLLSHLKYRVDTTQSFKKVDFPIKEMFYAIDTSTYVWEPIPEKQGKWLVKWLERGKINLYERLVEVNGLDYPFWYASKNSDTLVQVKTSGTFIATGSSRKKRKQALIDLLADNPAVLQSFNQMLKNEEYDYDLIRRYIQIYNVSGLPGKKTSN
jgi:hypothetical protein